MGRNTKILDGASINDIEEGVSYNYYGYTRSEGSWIIMRTNTAQTVLRYDVGGSDYATAWAGRAGLNYQTSDSFKY